MLKDYDYTILDHLEKANVVADALSRKNQEKLMILTSQEVLIKEFKKLEIEVKYPNESEEQLYMMEVRLTLLDKIKELQEKDEECEKNKKVNSRKRIWKI